jgi:hypothetical protein
MNTREIITELTEAFEDEDGDDDGLLLADGFEDALLGTVVGACREPVACYDYAQCIQILMERSEMDEDEAVEFFEFNTIGAYVGKKTPLFLHNLRNEPSGAEDVELRPPLDGA